MSYGRALSDDRFIPAGAGNTGSAEPHGLGVAVHPRGRGEHHPVRVYSDKGFGSSPRARGTHLQESSLHDANRFIPAGAGNTYEFVPPEDRVTVHPRGRGEHTRFKSTATNSIGSSPRARGTRYCRFRYTVASRFIPAGAGNTMNWLCAGVLTTVHPRGRGEHALGTFEIIARGHLARFIPAGAGNTLPLCN